MPTLMRPLARQRNTWASHSSPSGASCTGGNPSARTRHSQRERLGRGTPLSWRRMLQMIRKPGKLLDRIDAIHERERHELSQSQRSVARVHVKKILDTHTAKFKSLRSRQTEERRAEREAQWAKTRTI